MIATEPPAAALSAISRRGLLRSAGLAGAGLAAAAPLSAQLRARGFTHGVASGEPGADGVLLWTRFVGAQDIALEWQVSETLDFARTVSAGTLAASAQNDWCAKVRADGLAPGRWYYYRFIAPDGSISDTGRTRTLPVGETARFRIALVGCSNMGFGHFNAYGAIAEADRTDLVIHSGDYFYEYPGDTYPSQDQRVPGRLALPADRETVLLADYRLRHASYRADLDLRRLHQLFPMVLGWDDHESANDSWKGGAQNHQSETEGEWDARKIAAMRAYREWLPVSDAPWTSYQVGDLATILRTESRLLGRDKPPELADVLAKGMRGDGAVQALAEFRSGEWMSDERSMFGAEQERWIARQFKASTASGTRWQVMAQQTVMGSLSMPDAVAEGMTADIPDYIKQRIRAAAAASAVGLPFNMDAWDGYPAARERLLRSALDADANLLVLSGDSHNGWACNLDVDGTPAGVEFAGQSVTSPGAENSLPWIPADDLARALEEKNPQLEWAGLQGRGYVAIELTQDRAVSEWRFLETIRQRSTRIAGTHRMATAPGAQRFTG